MRPAGLPTISRLKRLMHEGAWVVLAQILTVVGALALVRAQTYYLDPTQLGELALTITLGTLLAQVTLFVVAPGILRFYSVAAENGLPVSYPNDVGRMIKLATLVASSLLVLVLMGLISIGQGERLLPTLLAGSTMIVSGIGAAWGGLFSAARARVLAGLHAAADPWLRLFILVSVASAFGAGVTNVLIAYLLTLVLLSGSQYVFAQRLLRRFQGMSPVSYREPMWAYSRPFVAINLLIWAQASADRWALQTFATTHDVGLLSVLLQLGVAPISMAVGTMTVFVTPILNNRMGDGSDQVRRNSARKLALVMLAVSVGLTLVATTIAAFGHELIFSIMVAPAYREVSFLLPWAAIAGGMVACTQVLYTRMMSELRTDLLILPRLVTSVLSITLGGASAYFWGLNGIIAAMVVYSTAQVVWLIVVTPRQS